MPVKIKFLGGVGTVTGSMHLIETSKSKVLIDCGLFQGHRDEYYRINSHFNFDPYNIDAVLISHAHIDHSGNLPNLTSQGFKGPIYTSEATADLCSLMLRDSAHIQEENIKYVNKINRRKGLPLRKSLYTEKDAENCLKFIKGKPYNEKFKITEDIEATFYDAGHILGSSVILLNIKSDDTKDINPANDGKQVNLAYAVDLGRENMPILRNPAIIKNGKIDYLVIDSTYGARLHGDLNKAIDKLAHFINKAAKNHGKVIIPSFALGRAQLVIYYLHYLIKKKMVPELPIYIDSPLTVNITDVFRKHPECFDKEAKELVYNYKSPFNMKNIHYISKVEESKRLNKDKQSMIIISASGMCEAGRILHHLKNNIEDKKNVVIIVGYMAENTLGKKLVDKLPVVKIFGEEYKLKSEVGVINAFSAHADKHELLDYINKNNTSIKDIFIVHGDKDQSKRFSKMLTEKGHKNHLPKKDEEITLS